MNVSILGPDSNVLAVGLMSGTSADGIDAVLVRIAGAGSATRVETIAFESYPFSDGLRERILKCMDTGWVGDICELNVLLGRTYGDAVSRLLKSAGVSPADVAFVASHGQTVYHIPRGQQQACSSLQLGDGSSIAEMTGILTVTDFRLADIAAGGEGAPLVPFFDRLVFMKPGVRRVLVNIGGVGNISLVADGEPLVAFDTGPGNAPLDLVAATTDPSLTHDPGGSLAMKGRVDEALLAELLAHPYFAAPPPKSTGRELFGREFVDALLKQWEGRRLEDLLATLTALTARSIANGIRSHLPRGNAIDEVIVSGGGIHNRTLMGMLREALAPARVGTSDEHGVASDAKEAIAFAVLGNQLMHALAGNLPEATGARHPALLGKISLPYSGMMSGA